MDKVLKNKYNNLKSYLNDFLEVVVAYSGGVDSTLLLKICRDELKDRAHAIIGVTTTMPEADKIQAIELAGKLGVQPILIETQELNSPDFCNNPTDRCYHCKKIIFSSFKAYLLANNLYNLMDGSNVDDLKDYRPGSKALDELGVLSPFIFADFTKADIRILSKELLLPTWDKEALACMATRIAYGEEITRQKLNTIEKAEHFLREKGFTYVRARVQGVQLRIETSAEQLPLLFADDMRQEVVKYMKNLGFKYVTIDMEGYRMGSMNN